MITVHHLNNSRSQRVLWLLEELALPYQIVRHERDPKTMLAPPALRAIHPLGKSPLLVDGDLVVAESGAILEYLTERYDTECALSPSLRPLDSPERLQFRYWMHYAEGSACWHHRPCVRSIHSANRLCWSMAIWWWPNPVRSWST
ncbi:glutathione S-transferase [Xanthomonas oryzae]|nr:glutathione S-transferase [Xanthomonas oryzae]